MYRVRFVDPARSYRRLQTELDAAYHAVMARGDLVARQQLERFEQAFARYVGVKHAIGVSSGFDALHIALRAARVGCGDEVIVPAHTFVATCSAIVHVNATPVLVDVGDDFNIDVDKIEEVITPRTRAIIPVHLSGYMADMPRLMQLANKYHLAVIEDACQSLGASVDGKMAGSWGHSGCWSFYPFKMLGAYGDGGAITTNDDAVALFAQRMRYNGEDRRTGEYHGHGFTALLDNLQAAFLEVKLRYLPAWIARRQALAARYRQGLSSLPGLLLPHYRRPGFIHVYQNYTVRSRYGDDFSDYLKKSGIEVLTQFRKPYYQHAALGLCDRGFKITQQISREVCSLPLHADLFDEEVDAVVDVVQAFYRHLVRGRGARYADQHSVHNRSVARSLG